MSFQLPFELNSSVIPYGEFDRNRAVGLYCVSRYIAVVGRFLTLPSQDRARSQCVDVACDMVPGELTDLPAIHGAQPFLFVSRVLKAHLVAAIDCVDGRL